MDKHERADDEPVGKRVRLVGPEHGAVDGQDAEGGDEDHGGGEHPKEHTESVKHLKVSKWRGRPRISKRDQLAQLSMMNFTFKNVGGGVISDRQGSVGSKGFKAIGMDELDTD